MNLLLVFMLMPIVYFLGINVPAFLEEAPVVGWVAKDSPAMKADFQIGDHILKVDDELLENWGDFYAHVQTKIGKDIKILIDRENSTQEKLLSLPSDILGIPEIGILYTQSPQVGKVFDGMPAQQAGLKPGDIVKKIDTITITHWAHMSEVIREYPGREIILTIERGEEILKTKIKPTAMISKVNDQSNADVAGLKLGDTILTVNKKAFSDWERLLRGKELTHEDKYAFEIVRDKETRVITVILEEAQDIGIMVVGKIGITPQEVTIFKKFGFFASIKEGFKNTIDLIGKIFGFLKILLSFEASIKQFGGPIMIAKMSGSAARSGLSAFIFFTAFLSLNLGIINLFPIPVLDGGHLLFFIIELIIRKPLGAKKIEIAQKIGIFLLILLMLTVTYNDILRFVPEKYLDFLPWK
jgi:regulator of sigma E protease